MIRLLILVATALILLFLFLPRAQAVDRPILVLRLEAELDYVFAERRVGLSGAVYTLQEDGARSGSVARIQSIQVAYNAENRAVLARLVHRITDLEDIQVFIAGAHSTLSYFLPDADIAAEEFSARLYPSAAQFLDTGSGSETQIDFSVGPLATLSFFTEGSLAVLDLPILTPPEERLSASALARLLSDATVEFPRAEGPPIHRYHTANGSYAQMQGSGTWEIDDQGRYCIERAPLGERRCAIVYRTGEGEYVEVLSESGAANPEIRPMQIVFGNPRGLTVPRHSDAIATAVAKMILPGRTEQRRRPDGEIDRVYLDTDGSIRGVWGGDRASGRWTVLDDGRRCLTVRGTGDGWLEAECAFLSETDGGTYRLHDGLGGHLGEALYVDGNPNEF